MGLTRTKERQQRAARLWEESGQRKDRRRAEDAARDEAKQVRAEAGLDKRTSLTTQTQRDIANIQGEHGMARQTLSGQQGIALQGLVGQQRTGEQTRDFDFRSNEAALQRQNALAVQDLADTQALQRSREKGAFTLMGLGVPGTDASRVAGTHPGTPLNLAMQGIQVPSKPDTQKPMLVTQPSVLGPDGRMTEGGQMPMVFDPQEGVMRRLPIQEPPNPFAEMTDEELDELLKKAR